MTTRLFEAGAIMVGKVQMTEGAFSVHHPDVTAPINPWHADHWPGVSSSGSGVATAAGLCYGAIGTDTGGSIRFPSGANGLTGLKPTWGRVSRHGVLPLADSLDHVGPMTRSAADAGAMLGAMAGVDPNDPTTLEAPVPDYLDGIEQGIRGLRIAFDQGFIYDVCEPDTAAVIDDARKVLADLGAKVTQVKMPSNTAAMYKEWAKFCAVETAVAHLDTYPSRAKEYGPVLADLIETGRKLDALELMQIYHARLVFQGQLRKLFQEVDLLLLPVHPFGNPSAASTRRRLQASQRHRRRPALHRAVRHVGQPDDHAAGRLQRRGHADRLPAGRSSSRRGPPGSRRPRLPGRHRMASAPSEALKQSLTPRPAPRAATPEVHAWIG